LPGLDVVGHFNQIFSFGKIPFLGEIHFPFDMDVLITKLLLMDAAVYPFSRGIKAERGRWG
jgi:hypothetical protein